MSVIVTSPDQKIHRSIICKSTDKFSILEKKFYEKYPEYSGYNNYFYANGRKILKYKTLKDNNIHDSDIITLIKKNI